MIKKTTLLICLMLTLSLLWGCAGQTAEIATMEPSAAASLPTETENREAVITVQNADELLAALNSSVTIELAPGDYDLSKAETYGQDSPNPAYYWQDTFDGFELVLNHLHDLKILGSGRDTTSLLNAPRLANILVLEGCSRIHLEEITLGHTEGADMCSGGVLKLTGCKNISIQDAGLFGCGIEGITAQDCEEIKVSGTDIYSCSSAGISVWNTFKMEVENCSFYSLGTSQQDAYTVFDLHDSTKIEIRDCSISENTVMHLLEQQWCEEVTIENTEFRANNITGSAFLIKGMPPVLDQCSLEGNDLRMWYALYSDMAVDPEGNPMTEDRLPPVVTSEAPELGDQKTIHVSTADEFLAAIGPDTEIILDAPVLDLSTASGYGESSSNYYFWEDIFDGPGLIIRDVINLTIRAEGQDITSHVIQSVPRYADVLAFQNCDSITLAGFTAGHTEQQSTCAGAVLGFTDSDRITVRSCGLFGCGVLGVDADHCSALAVTDCDIYDCSNGGIQGYNVQGVTIQNNTFRDLGGPEIILTECSDVDSDVVLEALD